jgi:hypothetical protein
MTSYRYYRLTVLQLRQLEVQLRNGGADEGSPLLEFLSTLNDALHTHPIAEPRYFNVRTDPVVESLALLAAAQELGFWSQSNPENPF